MASHAYGAALNRRAPARGETLALIEPFRAAYERKDLTAVMALFGTEVRDRDVAGRPAVEHLYEKNFATLDDIRYELAQLDAKLPAGDGEVVVEGRFRIRATQVTDKSRPLDGRDRFAGSCARRTGRCASWASSTRRRPMKRRRVLDQRCDCRWRDRLIEAGALFLLVFTPLAYGTVEPWAEAIAELVVLGMVLVWLLGMLRDWELRIDLPPGWLPIYLFLGPRLPPGLAASGRSRRPGLAAGPSAFTRTAAAYVGASSYAGAALARAARDGAGGAEARRRRRLFPRLLQHLPHPPPDRSAPSGR